MEKLAIEYGDGLFALAQEENALDAVRQDCALVRRLLLENPGYISLITSRKIEKEEKKKLLTDCFSGKVHPYVFNFLCFMNDRGYFPYVSACFYRFEERYFQVHGMQKVTVRCAVMPEEDRKAAIKAGIEKKTGKKAEIEWIVDPSLLAGIRAEADGILLENSARKRIDDLKKQLRKSVT